MTALLRAEVLKLRTVWSTYVIVGLAAAVSMLLGIAVAFAPRRGTAALLPPHGTAGWFDNVFSAMLIAQDVALVLGVLVVTGEYRHRTVTSVYLAEPRRGRVIGAKLAVSTAAGAVVGLAAAVGGLLLGAALVVGGNGSMGTMLTEYRHVMPGMLAAAVLFALYGSGLGALLRNQVLALVVGLGVTGIVEPIFVVVWPAVGRWLPNQAARSLASVVARDHGGVSGGLVHVVAAWQGALVLVAYAVVLAVAGSRTTMRADVT